MSCFRIPSNTNWKTFIKIKVLLPLETCLGSICFHTRHMLCGFFLFHVFYFYIHVPLTLHIALIKIKLFVKLIEITCVPCALLLYAKNIDLEPFLALYFNLIISLIQLFFEKYRILLVPWKCQGVNFDFKLKSSCKLNVTPFSVCLQISLTT